MIVKYQYETAARGFVEWGVEGTTARFTRRWAARLYEAALAESPEAAERMRADLRQDGVTV